MRTQKEFLTNFSHACFALPSKLRAQASLLSFRFSGSEFRVQTVHTASVTFNSGKSNDPSQFLKWLQVNKI